MKKILVLFVSIIALATTANAGGMIKNYTGYTVLGKKLDEVLPYVHKTLRAETEIKQLTGTPNAYYATYGEEHYYMKFYPANNNTNIYVVADVEYDKNSNALTQFFDYYDMKYQLLEDSDALKEYKFDFVDYARTGSLEGLFILPDYIKPLKTGMGKLNDKITKNSKNASVMPYSVDNDPINLECVNTSSYVNDEAQVSITVKEYRLKNKQNKYVHAFEYLVKNNASTPIMVDKVTSERLATMKDITTQTFVDLDRLDLLDTVGSFPPVAICTFGTSLAFTVANNVRLAKVAKESLRYSRSLPENQEIKGNSSMRILVLKFKNDPKPLNFSTTREGQKFNFSF